MANETILIVDADTKSQKVLEVSFKKAGYRVVMTDGPRRAEELVRDTSPDIIISDTAFPNGGDGFEFLAAVKSGPAKAVPFIFLTEERSLPQKMKGFELGADDYLTKPIYIKEVTTRVELLLQKRAKESLSDENIEELEGNLADITMIDLLQTIEEELRSGTIHLTLDMQSAVIYFREGNILDAICGKLQGEEAIYRLMLWPDGEFVLRYHDQVRRMDRIEKDSGALLLEGIRRLDKYNELVDKLPGLGRIFEADFERLTRMANALPDEVGRVVRLFDGLRSIREVCEGSPLDDVTTLKIVARLIEDDLITDVTPERGQRAEMKTRSNLAAWLEGARSEPPAQTEYVREDTSPKFGSSITEMVEKRSTDRHARPQRQTLDNPFAAIDAAEEEEEEIDPRRQTHIQWDVRGKSDWNIVLDDVAPNPSAAIREIEAEEHRRRELEARQLSDSGPRSPAPEPASDDSHRESTLRFAPAVDREQHPDLNQDLIRRIEEDEHRRRDEEARRLQEQLQSMQAQDGPLGATPRRSTDELPIQRRPLTNEPEDEQEAPPTLFGSDPRGSGEYQQPRERVNTPLSAPAFVSLEEPSSEPHLDQSPGLDVLSEADAFEDDSDELPRSERSTLDLRPPGDLFAREDTADVDPGELFALAAEETAPADDSMDDFDILLEPMPTVERQAKDRELVRAEFDLSRRRTVSPNEISGRMSSWERETVELPKSDGSAPATSKQEGAFFEADTPTLHEFYDEEESGGTTQMVWIVGLLGVVAVGLVMLFLSGPSEEPDEVAQKPAVEEPAQVEAPPEVPEVAEVDPLLVVPGLDADAASQRATEYGSNVGTGSQELAAVMSGEVLGIIEEDPSGEDAVEPEETLPEDDGAGEQLAVNTPAEVPAETTVEKDPEPEKVKEPPKKDEPVTASPAQVKEARSLIQRDRYDEALTLLRKLSDSAPKDKEIAYLHGIAAFNSNHTGEAIESLSRAERLGKRTADLYLELAAAYQLDRKPDKAKWAYEKFLALQPNGRQADEVRSILSTQF